MRIPEAKIDEIRYATDIVDYVSGFVQLRKRGKNYIGLCPFHQEKTPSFTVSGEKQIFHCFGCHKGGNVFKFLMEYKNLSFVEAVQEIAEQSGIKLDVREGYDDGAKDENEALYEINKAAAIYFSNNLLSADAGEPAREYFKKRNIKTATQKTFGLGFAFPEWEHLMHFLEQKKTDLKLAETLGLIDKRADGSYYDKFRERVMFPIFSPNGRVIGFGGRVFEKNAKVAKYLNSPESPIYFKRRSLYGIFHSKEEIRKLDRAILVEGYMDLLALFQAGIQNVVASSGTSLTEEQVQLLSRYTKNIVVIFDSDTAGEKASMRSIEILLKYDFDIRIAALPEGEDPDSYVSNFGKDEFNELIKKAENFLEYQTAKFEERGMFEDPATYSEAVRELVQTIAFVNDELKRNILIKTISKKFNLREKLLESELDKALSKGKRRQNRRTQKEVLPAVETNGTTPENPDRFSPVERDIVKLLFEGNAEVIGMIFDEIQPEDLLNRTFRYIARIVFDCFQKDIVSPADLIEKIEKQAVREYLLELTLETTALSKRWDENDTFEDPEAVLLQYTDDLIKRFQLNRIEKELKTNNERLNGVTEADVMKSLLEEQNNLLKQKAELLAPEEDEED